MPRVVAPQANAADMLSQRARSGVSAAANTPAATGQDLRLLRRPRVFTLAINWESAQVSHHTRLPICALIVVDN